LSIDTWSFDAYVQHQHPDGFCCVLMLAMGDASILKGTGPTKGRGARERACIYKGGWTVLSEFLIATNLFRFSIANHTAQRRTMATFYDNNPRPRRVSTRGMVVIACLGSVVADSNNIILGTPPKKPPPPPRSPLISTNTNESLSSAQHVNPPVTMATVEPLPQDSPPKLPPPPPPRHAASEGGATKIQSVVPPPPIRKEADSTPHAVEAALPSCKGKSEMFNPTDSEATVSVPPPPIRKQESNQPESRNKINFHGEGESTTIEFKHEHDDESLIVEDLSLVVEELSLEPPFQRWTDEARETENHEPTLEVRLSENTGEADQEEGIEMKLQESNSDSSIPNLREARQARGTAPPQPPNDFFPLGSSRRSTGTFQQATPPPPPPQAELVVDGPPQAELVVDGPALTNEGEQSSTIIDSRTSIPPPPAVPLHQRQQQLQQQNLQQQHHYQQQHPSQGVHVPHQLPYSSIGHPQMTTSQRLQPPRYSDGPHPSLIPWSSGSSTWKSLWNKVERGLDDLAGLEETIASNAQKLVSSVAPGSLFQGKNSMLKEHPPNQMTQRPTTVMAKRRTPSVSSEHLRPYGQKYEQIKKNPPATQSSATQPSRPIDWNDLMAGKKMIRANGGASEPPQGALSRPHVGANPIKQSPLPQQPPPRGPPPSPGSAQLNPQAQNAGPGRPANPYAPPNSLQPQPQPPGQTQPHARGDRIPWDTNPQALIQQHRQARPPPTRRLEREDDDARSWKLLLARILSPLPRPSSLARIFRKKDSYSAYANLDAWNVDDEDERGSGLFGFFQRRNAQPSRNTPSTLKNNQGQAKDALAPPVADLLRRYSRVKGASVLLDSDKRQCRSIARSRGTLDAVFVIFVLLGLQQLNDLNSALIDWSSGGFSSMNWLALGPWIAECMSTWAPFAFAAAYLTTRSNNLLFENKIRFLASSAAQTVEEESLYGQLFLRLYGAVPLDTKLPQRIRHATYTQISSLVSACRLRWYVTLILSALVIMTISVVRPIVMAVCGALSHIVLHDSLRSWPVPRGEIVSASKTALRDLFTTLEGLIAGSLTEFLDSPGKFAFHLSIFVSLLTVSFLPTLELRRQLKSTAVEEEEGSSAMGRAGQVAKLGTSSASRLGLLSVNGSIETILERWQMLLSSSSSESAKRRISTTIRLLGYMLLAALATLLPVVVSTLFSSSLVNVASKTSLKWDSLMDVSVVLVSVLVLVYHALRDAIASMDARPYMLEFLETLSQMTKEISILQKSQSDMQLPASLSPTAGLAVNDLWAAHTSKRAWAVRGASLFCKNGEILVLLGDDGHGKTRLLTTLAECMLTPPRSAISSNKVRGSISLGGIDIAKWDRNLVRRRLGVLLSDVRTVADMANLFSGLTLEEILEPVDFSKGINPSHKLNPGEKSAMVLALKVSRIDSLPLFLSLYWGMTNRLSFLY
jgi:ABC-type multidrug transport system fused ATPase/permease subunit